ncbi:hypothetical protein R3P38DRAFT_2783116 [Favolaschia claudopus]|uniref:Uncharacterized protein n=1 Tax=Favolaschia claudopus TaxID=2862362 RepID=A0AAW0B214_9AGAR
MSGHGQTRELEVSDGKRRSPNPSVGLQIPAITASKLNPAIPAPFQRFPKTWFHLTSSTLSSRHAALVLTAQLRHLTNSPRHPRRSLAGADIYVHTVQSYIAVEPCPPSTCTRATRSRLTSFHRTDADPVSPANSLPPHRPRLNIQHPPPPSTPRSPTPPLALQKQHHRRRHRRAASLQYSPHASQCDPTPPPSTSALVNAKSQQTTRPAPVDRLQRCAKKSIQRTTSTCRSPAAQSTNDVAETESDEERRAEAEGDLTCTGAALETRERTISPPSVTQKRPSKWEKSDPKLSTGQPVHGKNMQPFENPNLRWSWTWTQV